MGLPVSLLTPSMDALSHVAATVLNTLIDRWMSLMRDKVVGSAPPPRETMVGPHGAEEFSGGSFMQKKAQSRPSGTK